MIREFIKKFTFVSGAREYSNKLYFIYDPNIGLTLDANGLQQDRKRSMAMIFMNNVSENVTVVFTASCSAEVKVLKKDFDFVEKAAEICKLKFQRYEIVRDYFCKYLPPYGKL